VKTDEDEDAKSAIISFAASANLHFFDLPESHRIHIENIKLSPDIYSVANNLPVYNNIDYNCVEGFVG
jgi:hypothetical protein